MYIFEILCNKTINKLGIISQHTKMYPDTLRSLVTFLGGKTNPYSCLFTRSRKHSRPPKRLPMQWTNQIKSVFSNLLNKWRTDIQIMAYSNCEVHTGNLPPLQYNNHINTLSGNAAKETHTAVYHHNNSTSLYNYLNMHDSSSNM